MKQTRRDHLIGKLFGYKAILQSGIVIKPELSMECWNQLLDHIYGMACDVPWLREECGMVLVEAVKSLQGHKKYQECAKEVIGRLSTYKLVATPEGVAIWLTVKAAYEEKVPEILPGKIWHCQDPLSNKERSRLAKVLKENYQGGGEEGADGMVKTAAANPNPTFTWDLVFSEVLRRDNDTGATKPELPRFWIDIIDGKLVTKVRRQG
jgi:DNA polymerase phi